MAKLLYLAGPIDYSDEIEPGWREEVHELMLKEEGWVTYDPSRAFTIGDSTEPDESIRRVNQMAIARSNALIGFLPDGVQTFGTIEELTIAHHEGIPVAIVSTTLFPESWSLAHIARFQEIDAALAFLLGSAYVLEQEYRYNIKVKRLDDAAILPTRAHSNDAGWDLYACQDIRIPAGEMRDVPVGISIEPPAGYWFRIVGRSSTFRKRGLLMIEGIIDEGYRGPLYFGAYNTTNTLITVKHGERLCQAILHRSPGPINIEWAEHLSPSERGGSGFGSSGE
jgi:dUTP pyrophosphatase